MKELVCFFTGIIVIANLSASTFQLFYAFSNGEIGLFKLIVYIVALFGVVFLSLFLIIKLKNFIASKVGSFIKGKFNSISK